MLLKSLKNPFYVFSYIKNIVKNEQKMSALKYFQIIVQSHLASYFRTQKIDYTPFDIYVDL